MVLINAVINNNLAEIERILSANSAIHEVDKRYKRGVLHWAAVSGHAALIHILVKHGANVNAKDKDGATPVCLAAENGHAAVIAALHAHGADLNQADYQGNSPLFIALAYNHFSAVLAILKTGAEVNAVDPTFGRSALHWVSYYNYISPINVLIEYGADVNQLDQAGATPIFLAAEQGHHAIITKLHDHGAYVNGIPFIKSGNEHAKLFPPVPTDQEAECIKKKHPLLIAAKYGRTAAIGALLQAGADLRARDCSGETALYWAAYNGSLSATEALIRAHLQLAQQEKKLVIKMKEKDELTYREKMAVIKKNIEQCTQGGRTAVHAAALAGQATLILLLRDYEAELDQPDNAGQTPLYLAAQGVHSNTCMALLKAGAKIQPTLEYANQNLPRDKTILEFLNSLHQTFLEQTAFAQEKLHYYQEDMIFNEEFIHTLLLLRLIKMEKVDEANFHAQLRIGMNRFEQAFINSTDRVRKGNLIYWIAFYGRAQLLDLLIQWGADIHCQDTEGSSVLFVAAQNGHLEILKKLIPIGAQVNQRNAKQLSPLAIAIKNNHKEIVTALLDAGANALEADLPKPKNNPEIEKILEAHLKQYPDGINPLNPQPVPLGPPRLSTTLEQKNMYRFHQPAPPPPPPTQSSQPPTSPPRPSPQPSLPLAPAT